MAGTTAPPIVPVAGSAFVRPQRAGDGVRLYGATSGYVGLKPAAAAGGTDFTLPAADGGAGLPLVTNGSGGLSIPSADTFRSTLGLGTADTVTFGRVLANRFTVAERINFNEEGGQTGPMIQFDALSGQMYFYALGLTWQLSTSESSCTASGNQCLVVRNDSFTVNVEGTNRFLINTANGAMFNINTVPFTNNTYTLGTSIRRWSTVYGVNADFSGDVTIAGTLTTNGTTVINTEVTVNDPLIRLADENVADTLDLGFYGKYVQAATDKYRGLFFDASDGKWKLFTGLQSEPTTTVNIAGTGYSAATLVVGAIEATTFTGVDHGSIGGLADDDHAQYALLAGRAGGQMLVGGTAASENLTLSSTAHATKGKIFFGASSQSLYDGTNIRLGIGTGNITVQETLCLESGSPRQLRLVDNVTQSPYLAGYTTSTGSTRLGYLQFSSSDCSLVASTGKLSFYAGSESTVRMTIDSSGRMGVGIAPTSTALIVLQNQAASKDWIRFTASDGGLAAEFFENADTSAALHLKDGGSTTQIILDAGAKTVQLTGGVNVVLDATTGTKIGTATGQKLAFWNSTPVAQQVLATGGGATVDNVISLLQTLGLCKQA